MINFFITYPIATFQRKYYISTQILIIDKQNFTTFIILEKINQPKLKYFLLQFRLFQFL